MYSKSEGANLKEAIKYLIAFRFIFLLVMGVSALMLAVGYKDEVSATVKAILFWGGLFTILSSLIYPFLPERVCRVFAWTQVVADLLITTYLIAQAPDSKAVFSILYSVQILLATVVLRQEGAVGSALLASGLFSFATILQVSSWRMGDITQLMFVMSLLLFFGGVLGALARNRDRLRESLDSVNTRFESLSHLHSAVIDHISSGIICLEPQTKTVTLMNSSALKILGENWTGRQLEGGQLEGLLDPTPRKEIRLDLKGGPRVIGYHSTNLPDGSTLIAFQDLTEIRELEGQMKLNDKLVSVGKLAAGIAHEIRNPLASLSGSVQLLRKEMPVESSSEKLMRIVLRETDRLDALIKNFLSYAKPSEIQAEEVQLRKSVEEVLVLLRNIPGRSVNGIRLENSVDESHRFKVDPRQLKQILWNLILNAVDSVEGSGRVEIRSSEAEKAGEKLVRLEVEDSGKGIPDAVKGRIFDPFFTTKPEGTGLGLALVYQMVKAHGGCVGVESMEGHGSTFWVEFFQSGPKENARRAA